MPARASVRTAPLWFSLVRHSAAHSLNTLRSPYLPPALLQPLDLCVAFPCLHPSTLSSSCLHSACFPVHIPSRPHFQFPCWLSSIPSTFKNYLYSSFFSKHLPFHQPFHERLSRAHDPPALKPACSQQKIKILSSLCESLARKGQVEEGMG